MLKLPVKYVDFNGIEREEDFYFNLTKAEVAELELGRKGGLVKYLQQIMAEEDSPKIVQMMKEIVLMSYGVKSEDGKRFIKTEELRTEFSQTAAYSEVFIALSTDAKAAADFMNGILPADLTAGPQDHKQKEIQPSTGEPAPALPADLEAFQRWQAEQTKTD